MTQKELSSTKSDDQQDVVFNSGMKPSHFEFDLNKSNQSKISNTKAPIKEVVYSQTRPNEV